MKFKLKPEARQKMEESLTESFKDVYVDNDIYPNFPSFFMAGYRAQQHLPENVSNREFMEQCIGDMPFIEFITEKIRIELTAERDYKSEAPRAPLIGSPGYPDAAELARRLISEFESLPWTYRITIELSQEQLPPELFEGGAIAIGDRASLLMPDLLFAETYPLDHENERVARRIRSTRGLGMLLLGNKKQEWKSTGVCFSQTVEGFIGAWGTQEPVKFAQNQLEAFIGLGLAKKCFTFRRNFNDPAPKFRWIIHQVDQGGNNVPLTSVDVEEEVSTTLKLIQTFQFSKDYPEASRIPWLKLNLVQIGRAFQASKNEKLLLASK